MRKPLFTHQLKSTTDTRLLQWVSPFLQKKSNVSREDSPEILLCIGCSHLAVACSAIWTPLTFGSLWFRFHPDCLVSCESIIIYILRGEFQSSVFFPSLVDVFVALGNLRSVTVSLMVGDCFFFNFALFPSWRTDLCVNLLIKQVILPQLFSIVWVIIMAIVILNHTLSHTSLERLVS